MFKTEILCKTSRCQLHQDTWTPIRYQVRVFAYGKVGKTLLNHVCHLRISFIRRHKKLNFDLLKYIHEQVNHFSSQHKTATKMFAGFFLVPLFIHGVANFAIALFTVDSFLVCV